MMRMARKRAALSWRDEVYGKLSGGNKCDERDTYLLIHLIRPQPVLKFFVQSRHLLYRTFLSGNLGNLRLEATSFRTSFQRAGVEKKNVVLADIDVMGFDGRALGRGPCAAEVDADEADSVVGKANATERTGRRKTSWCFFDDVVAAVQA